MSLPIGAQLYSIRDDAGCDYAATLEKLAAIGFAGVEFYGGRVLPARELKAHLDGLGLVSIGYHVLMDELANNLDEVLEYNCLIGSGFIVCPWHTYRSRQDYIETAAFFDEVGERCKLAGLQFCYHHHGHEFERFDGEYGLDILFAHSSPELVQAELDTHYVRQGGIDPLDYLEQYRGRCPLLHLRDVGQDGKTAVLMGKGILDMTSIIEKAEDTGVRWLIAEEDCNPAVAMESMRQSYNHLAKICACLY